MMNMPLIRLELEQMRYQVVHALGSHQQEISAAVDKELEKVINEFDFTGTVAVIANQVIKEKVEEYFKYGRGRGTIEAAVKEGLDNIFAKGTGDK